MFDTAGELHTVPLDSVNPKAMSRRQSGSSHTRPAGPGRPRRDSSNVTISDPDAFSAYDTQRTKVVTGREGSTSGESEIPKSSSVSGAFDAMRDLPSGPQDAGLLVREATEAHARVGARAPTVLHERLSRASSRSASTPPFARPRPTRCC